jgi:hypothetical protein
MKYLRLMIILGMIAIVSVSAMSIFSAAISSPILVQGSTADSTINEGTNGYSNPANNQSLTMSEMSNATSIGANE